MTTRDDWRTPLPGLRLIRRGTTPTRRIQLYGQRCSGTNVVARTIATNIAGATLTEQFGFKHWFVPDQIVFAPDVLVVVVARDAFDWVRSLHRQPWHAHPTLKAQPFARFIRNEWHSVWDEHVDHIEPGHPMLGTEMRHERNPATGERFAHCIAMRTAKLRHWSTLSTRAHNVALIGYDAFARAPADHVAAIADAAGLARREPFAPVASYKGQGHAPYVPTPYPDLVPEDASHIEAWLDPAVEAAFGLRAHYALGPVG